MKAMRLMLLFAVGSTLGPVVLSAQSEPVRVGMLGDPRVGREAPDFTLPYFTVAGPGPVDQPFHLRAELGHTVVLVIGGSAADSAVQRTWRALAGAADSLFRPGVVVAGVLADSAGAVAALARALPEAFKLMADVGGATRRQYGVRGREVAVYVVSDEGRVTYRRRGFRADRAGDLAGLRGALGG